jgi:hypothetical protein
VVEAILDVILAEVVGRAILAGVSMMDAAKDSSESAAELHALAGVCKKVSSLTGYQEWSHISLGFLLSHSTLTAAGDS